MIKHSFCRWVFIVILAASLAGCDYGGDNQNSEGTTYKPGQLSVYYLGTVSNISLNMRYVPKVGDFPAGNDDLTHGRVTTAYWMAETEVTYQLWSTVYQWATDTDRGANQYHFQDAGTMGDGSGNATEQHPVTFIDSYEAMVWCNALTEYYNAQRGTGLSCVYASGGNVIRNSNNSNNSLEPVTAIATAKGFRLPTSMEWELAARYQDGSHWTSGHHVSGDTTSYCYPQNAGTSTAFGDYAWYQDNSSGATHPVKGKTPNALGLYDMSGNVQEWNFDLRVVDGGYSRAYHGGSWMLDASFLPIGIVNYVYPVYATRELGFRIARTE